MGIVTTQPQIITTFGFPMVPNSYLETNPRGYAICGYADLCHLQLRRLETRYDRGSMTLPMTHCLVL